MHCSKNGFTPICMIILYIKGINIRNTPFKKFQNNATLKNKITFSSPKIQELTRHEIKKKKLYTKIKLQEK